MLRSESKHRRKISEVVFAFLFSFLVMVSACTSFEVVSAHKSFAVSETNLSLPKQKPFFVSRYIAHMSRSEDSGDINEHAVDLLVAGEYIEARILLEKAYESAPWSAEINNNLGVACELSGEDDSSFAAYSRACMLAPGTKEYEHNLRNSTNIRR